MAVRTSDVDTISRLARPVFVHPPTVSEAIKNSAAIEKFGAKTPLTSTLDQPFILLSRTWRDLHWITSKGFVQ